MSTNINPTESRKAFKPKIFALLKPIEAKDARFVFDPERKRYLMTNPAIVLENPGVKLLLDYL